MASTPRRRSEVKTERQAHCERKIISRGGADGMESSRQGLTDSPYSTIQGMGMRILIGAMAFHDFTESHAVANLPRK